MNRIDGNVQRDNFTMMPYFSQKNKKKGIIYNNSFQIISFTFLFSTDSQSNGQLIRFMINNYIISTKKGAKEKKLDNLVKSTNLS